MNVRDIMQTRVPAYREQDLVDVVADRMRFRALSALPVVDGKGALLGIITLMDLLELAARRRRSAMAREILKPAPALARPGSPLPEVIELMQRHGMTSLPVVDERGLLAGMVTDADALVALAVGQRPLSELLAIPIERVMTPDPSLVGEDATVLDAARIFVDGGFRHLPVVDANRRLVGIVSERDLRTVVPDLLEISRVPSQDLDESIAAFMAEAPISVTVGTPVGEVLDAFTRDRVGALPVVDDNDRVVGIVSYIDLLRWLREPARAAEIETQPGIQ